MRINTVLSMCERAKLGHRFLVTVVNFMTAQGAEWEGG
jgi:hypothetical protein